MRRALAPGILGLAVSLSCSRALTGAYLLARRLCSSGGARSRSCLQSSSPQELLHDDPQVAWLQTSGRPPETATIQSTASAARVHGSALRGLGLNTSPSYYEFFTRPDERVAASRTTSCAARVEDGSWWVDVLWSSWRFFAASFGFECSAGCRAAQAPSGWGARGDLHDSAAGAGPFVVRGGCQHRSSLVLHARVERFSSAMQFYYFYAFIALAALVVPVSCRSE